VASAVVVVVLALSASVAGTQTASEPVVPAGGAKVEADDRLGTRWVRPGDAGAVTFSLRGVPQDVWLVDATFEVSVRSLTGPTRITLCEGTAVTRACERAAEPVAGRSTFTQTVEVLGERRTLTVQSSTAKAGVSVRLVGYTMLPAASVTTSPTSPSSEPPSGDEPTIPQDAPSVTAPPTAMPTDPSSGSSSPPRSNPTAGWPGPSNTGVPAGTRLTVHEGDLRITQDGTVIDGLEIRGLVRVEAKDVVIKNSLITGRPLTSSMGLVYVNGPGHSVTVQDSELYARHPSPHVMGVVGQNFTLERVNIHQVIDQVHIVGDNVVVKDSWLHHNLHFARDPNHNNTPSHDDNVQIQAGRNIRIVHNTMESTHNAAIQVTQDMGVVANLTVENNLLSNGGCTVNLAQKARGPLTGITLRNNRFTRTSTHGCAVIVSAPSFGGLSLSDNRWVRWTGSSWEAEPGTVAVIRS